MIVGKQSILFEENVYIEETACVAGQKESEGPLGKLFDVVVEDAMAGMENWEEAESTLQQLAVDKLLEKWDGKKEDLRYIFAGDLLGQLIATSFGLMQYEIPMFGLYGACSTFGEALSLAAMTVHAGYAGHVIALASSHFASAEKQSRNRAMCTPVISFQISAGGGTAQPLSPLSDPSAKHHRRRITKPITQPTDS